MGKNSEYVAKTVENGQIALGLSDHGNVSGTYQLISECKKNDLIAVPGCEFYVAPMNPLGAKVKEPVFYGPNGTKAAQYDVSNGGAYTHQTIFAINNVGLQNLFKLSTMSNDPEHFYATPRIDFSMLAEHSEGLVVFTGCPSSEISTRFLLNQDKEAIAHASRLKEVFGDRLFVEIMEHGMKSPIERLLLPKQMELSRRLGIPLVATNDSHYTNKTDAGHHEEMLCAQSGAQMRDATWDEGGKRFAFDGTEFYLKTAAEMAELFPHEDFPDAILNTRLIAEMAQDINIEYSPHLRPTPPVPDSFDGPLKYLRHLINEGFKRRYGDKPAEYQKAAWERIEYEFEVIHSSNFNGYFLTVQEYCNWTTENFAVRDPSGNVLASPLGAGRGSVGGSAIAFVLGISEIDPLRWGTIFERFLSAGRGDIYEVTYDDGTIEEVVVSTKRTVVGENGPEEKYIHELQVDDEVILDDTEIELETEMPESAGEAAPKPAPEDTEPEVEVDSAEGEETNVESEVTVVKTARMFDNEPLVDWTDRGPYYANELADLDRIPF